MNHKELSEKFKILLTSGMSYSTLSHRLLFENQTNINVALSYLNAAFSRFSSAEALYYAKYDILQDTEMDNIFFYFRKYADEFLQNVSTNHSHQWTDIEFDRLNEAFKASPFLSDNTN